jgi:hypothetical protein
MEKTKNKAFAVIQAVMIALAVIAIVFVVAIKIIGQQVTSELNSNRGNNCGLNATGGDVGVSYTNCGSGYNGLLSLRTEIINSITWVGISVVVVIGFALIRMMTNKN